MALNTKSPKADWVTRAVELGEDKDVAETMAKAALIAHVRDLEVDASNTHLSVDDDDGTVDTTGKTPGGKNDTDQTRLHEPVASSRQGRRMEDQLTKPEVVRPATKDAMETIGSDVAGRFPTLWAIANMALQIARDKLDVIVLTDPTSLCWVGHVILKGCREAVKPEAATMFHIAATKPMSNVGRKLGVLARRTINAELADLERDQRFALITSARDAVTELLSNPTTCADLAAEWQTAMLGST